MKATHVVMLNYLRFQKIFWMWIFTNIHKYLRIFTIFVHGIRFVLENYALRDYYAASANFLPTFRDNLSVPSSKVKNLEEP